MCLPVCCFALFWLGQRCSPHQTHRCQCWHLCSRDIGNHLLCVTSGSRTHLLTPPPGPSRVHHYGFCSAAPSCATMDLSEAGDAGSGCKDENCSNAFSSPVSHSDHLCKEHEPLFGFIELGGFRKDLFTFFWFFCISRRRPWRPMKAAQFFIFFYRHKKILFPIPLPFTSYQISDWQEIYIVCIQKNKIVNVYFYFPHLHFTVYQGLTGHFWNYQ